MTTDGFNGQWSPDGNKLAFSMGAHGTSGVGIFDSATKETELLTVPGRDPRWSPDGRYIAFVRDCQFLRLSELIAAEREVQHRAVAEEEVWIIKSGGTEPRRLARGGWPSWSQDSTHVYYQSREDKMLYLISIEGRDAEPRQVRACSNSYPSVSPDGQRVAYLEGGSLKVNELTSQLLLAQGPAPLLTRSGVAWSPTGRELCLGGCNDSDDRMGLCIYGLGRSEPATALGGKIMAGSWAPDRTNLLFTLGPPYFEIWSAALDPNVSTIEALGLGQTLEEHYQEMVRLHSRRIEADPLDAYAYSNRAHYYDCLHDQKKADADMRRWSAILSGEQPSDLQFAAPPAYADFTFGEPVPFGSGVYGGEWLDCFSYDGLEIYFDSDQRGGRDGGDLWVLKRASVNDDWGPPQNLGPVVNSPMDDFFSSISADGLTLYVTSNRASAYGGYDIWMTRRPTKNAVWGQVVNLGPTLNTGADEYHPWISADGLELYFGSDRYGGSGRSDIWLTRRATVNDPWQPPVNLGPVVNSPYNEMYPPLSQAGRYSACASLCFP